MAVGILRAVAKGLMITISSVVVILEVSLLTAYSTTPGASLNREPYIAACLCFQNQVLRCKMGAGCRLFWRLLPSIPIRYPTTRNPNRDVLVCLKISTHLVTIIIALAPWNALAIAWSLGTEECPGATFFGTSLNPKLQAFTLDA